MAVYPERRKGRLTGVWIAEAFDKDKERRRKRFPTKHEGERWADYISLTGAPPAEEAAKPAPVGHLFGDMVKEARERHPGWEGARDPSRDQRLTYLVDVIGADTPIEKITTGDLDRVVLSLKKRPGYEGRKALSAGTINRYLALGSAVFSYAHKRYGTPTPAMPWLEEDGQRIHWLTEAQEAAVLAVIRKEGRKDEALAVRVLARTGLRWSEFETLEPRQIAIEDGEAWVKLDKTKTNTPRDVPITPDLARELLRMVERGRVPKYYTFRDTLHRATRIAGQNVPLTPHILRHTACTRLVRAGVNLAIVQKFMGHSSIQTTLKYTHVADDDLQKALQKISPIAGQSNVVQFPVPQEKPENKGEVEATAGLEPASTVLQTDL